jgi:superkiller protein 3
VIGFSPTKTENIALQNLAGEALMRNRQLGQAEDAFEQARALDPNNARTLTNIGRIQNARDQELQAEQTFHKAIAADKTYALPWFHLGMMYLGQGLKEQGVKSLEEGLKRAPGDPMGTFQLAQIYWKDGKIEEAKKLLKEALKKPIVNQDTQTILANLLNKLEGSK